MKLNQIKVNPGVVDIEHWSSRLSQLSSHMNLQSLSCSCSSTVTFGVPQRQIKVVLEQVRKKTFETEILTSCAFSYVADIPAQDAGISNAMSMIKERRVAFQMSSKLESN